MKNSTDMGMNRTGIAMSPKASTETIEFAQKQPPSSQGDIRVETGVLTDYVRISEPPGKMPPPAGVKGAAAALMKKMTGKKPEAFIDKLGERLAFERGGVRLYDAVLAKCRGATVNIPGFDTQKLLEIRNEELQHFHMLTECIESIGADPTVMTPCADVVGVEAFGLMQVVNDPRISVVQSLSALLTAELTDNAGWENLIDLAGEMHMDDMVPRFQSALREEEEHLSVIKRLVKESGMMQVRGET